MKAIMYHYVQPFNIDYPNLKILEYRDFSKQLDYFEDKYGFVSKEDFLLSLKTGSPVNGVILTFDDGLLCHYEFAFKELLRRGLWGIFYIATQPFMERRILDVHRTHLLLGKYESIQVYNALKERFDKSLFDPEKINEFEEFTYARQKNDQYSLLVKRILNYFISYEYRSGVLDQLMRDLHLDEDEILLNFYVNDSQIREMHESGMVIGSHTIHHPVMSRLSVEEQKEQVYKSFEYLENTVGGLNHRTFCYPYGGFHSFTSKTEEILTEAGCSYSFNVEQRDILSNDLLMKPQALPRYDCNQFPYGQVRTS